MKKMKLLLPIAAAASAIAIATPLVTSCKITNAIDLTNFEPTEKFSQPSSVEGYNYQEATDAYSTNANADILKNDLLYTFKCWTAINAAKSEEAIASEDGTEETGESKITVNTLYANAKVNDLSYKYETMNIYGESYGFIVLNGNYEVNFKNQTTDLTEDDTYSKRVLTSEYSIKVNLKNAPYKLINTTWNGVVSTDSTWAIMPALYSSTFVNIETEEEKAAIYSQILGKYNTNISFDVKSTTNITRTLKESGRDIVNTTYNSVSEYIDKDHLASIDLTQESEALQGEINKLNGLLTFYSYYFQEAIATKGQNTPTDPVPAKSTEA